MFRKTFFKTILIIYQDSLTAPRPVEAPPALGQTGPPTPAATRTWTTRRAPRARSPWRGSWPRVWAHIRRCPVTTIMGAPDPAPGRGDTRGRRGARVWLTSAVARISCCPPSMRTCPPSRTDRRCSVRLYRRIPGNKLIKICIWKETTKKLAFISILTFHNRIELYSILEAIQKVLI